jgi:Tol biopolymer transport system component
MTIDPVIRGDTNAASDVYVGDMRDRSLERASITSTGRQLPENGLYPAISPDGRHVAFTYEVVDQPHSDDPLPDEAVVLVRDLDARRTLRIDTEHRFYDQHEYTYVDMSRDGAQVAFESAADLALPPRTSSTGTCTSGIARDRSRATPSPLSEWGTPPRAA